MQCDLLEDFSFYGCHHTKVHYTSYKQHKPHYSACKIENVVKNVHLFYTKVVFNFHYLFNHWNSVKAKTSHSCFFVLFFLIRYDLSGRMCFCGDLWDCLNVSCYLWCSTHCVYCPVYACWKKKKRSTLSSNCCVNALVSGVVWFLHV